ncbi:hypothetical protein D9757_009408 [Collybiopsis confluens]|uniref:Uncharacterized protein n=1 Tax=Collybiopsis confluens TaxID=2823264 RepID=A0A8H5M516_9AGAR|nr:hypothetical protein D9757_009408 [Collybiopsis confluens]
MQQTLTLEGVVEDVDAFSTLGVLVRALIGARDQDHVTTNHDLVPIFAVYILNVIAVSCHLTSSWLTMFGTPVPYLSLYGTENTSRMCILLEFGRTYPCDGDSEPAQTRPGRVQWLDIKYLCLVCIHENLILTRAEGVKDILTPSITLDSFHHS